VSIAGLAVNQVTGPAHGTLMVTTDGGFTYTPTFEFTGTDSFSYNLTGAGITSNTATVTITVAGFSVPTATADAYATPLNTPLLVAAPGLRANDTDLYTAGVSAQFFPSLGVPSATLFALYPGLTRMPNSMETCFQTTRVSSLFCGAVELHSDGSFTYTPSAGFQGVDYFFYRLTRGLETGNPVAVKISVGTPPVGVTDTYTATNSQQDPLVVNAPGVLRNDLNTLTSGHATTFAVLLSQPAFGKLTFNANGSFSYLPNFGFSGTDSFTYVPSTGMLGTSPLGGGQVMIGGELQGKATTVIINVR